MAGKSEDGPAASEDNRLERILGYLNFSSGATDPQFLSGINELFDRVTADSDTPTWSAAVDTLNDELQQLQQSSATFSDIGQAERCLDLLSQFCPAYTAYHSDLLEHQTEEYIFNSLFVGRVVELILSQGLTTEPAENDEATIQRAIRKLSDYIGYRPVATLESQKIEPYSHEYVRPIPIYIKGVGAAKGKYAAIIERCLEHLGRTDPELLRAAYFDPDRLNEISLDPRAYDFDHPANKRPNYHFGQWDPHHIDGDGFYTRFVVQQLTIDSLLERTESAQGLTKEELITEAAAVLAGTILMSSGIGGYGPGTHHSTVSLAKLLAQIAGYRDEFYLRLLRQLDGPQSARLTEEANRLQQPFGGARQDLNRRLTELRARQLQRVHLARIFARMNYHEAATEQVQTIHVPSARIGCDIDCHLTKARTDLKAGRLADALQAINASREALLRGIECGAIVDPWNILGFDANFCLFGGIENSIRDYRVDDLVDVVEETNELYAQLWSKAAANEQDAIAQQTSGDFHSFVEWWHQFAAHEIDSVDAEDPMEVFDAAKNVATALQAWKLQGEASGDIGFWAPHVQKFDSCRAYWLVINTLLSRDDKVAALGLLMHWLSQSDRIPLEHGDTSFFRMSLNWLAAALRETGTIPADGEKTGWKRVRRFFDYLEANAGEFWEVPVFTSDPIPSADKPERETDLDGDDEEDERFGAAYENVVYRDSTDDGMESSIFDFDSHDEDYLQQVSRPIVSHLSFIDQLSLTWKLMAVAWSSARATQASDAVDPETYQQMQELLQSARSHLQRTSQGLAELIESVRRYRIAAPTASPDAVVNYDRMRLLKDSLLEQIMSAQVSVTEGLQFLIAAADVKGDTPTEPGASDQDVRHLARMLGACLRNDTKRAKQLWPEIKSVLEDNAILYVPLNRGGDPDAIVEVRSRQQLVQNLLYWLPRLGLLQETFELIEVIRRMELKPVGHGAITEFDDLFEVACRSIVTALIDAKATDEEGDDVEDWLLSFLEEMMEPLLRSWLGHSRTLRLSVLERVIGESEWDDLVTFIRSYGRDLFTQRFLNPGNVRGILHQGVESWLSAVEESQEDEYQSILDALQHDLDREYFVDRLNLILEAVLENYSEYRDYNSTTTQSDRGDQLYTLLDFLRLRISYDRVVWNLRPVVLAHQVIASRGKDDTADEWRRSLRKRIQGEAKRHVLRLQQIQQKYAMQLPSISKRISEQFMRPLMIDHLCALIEPAMFDESEEIRLSAFDGIKEQAEVFMNEPSGAGLEVPAWIVAMEETVISMRDKNETSLGQLLESQMLPPVNMSLSDIRDIVDSWQSPDASESSDEESE